ncbi:MAG TPA: helix-turn-helix domain-containing protein, partial [Acidobacteriaceae bacterium]
MSAYTSSKKASSETPNSSSAAAPTRRGDRNESQTVLRACEVLKAFRSLGEDLSLTDVIDRTQLPKTTVFRLLRTLIHGGLLERASSGVYRNRFGPVTARPLRIGFAAQGDSEFCRAVMQSVETAAARE